MRSNRQLPLLESKCTGFQYGPMVQFEVDQWSNLKWTNGPTRRRYYVSSYVLKKDLEKNKRSLPPVVGRFAPSPGQGIDSVIS